MVIALFFQFLAHYFDVYDLEEGCLRWIELYMYSTGIYFTAFLKFIQVVVL